MSSDGKYLFYADNADVIGTSFNYYFVNVSKKNSVSEKLDTRIGKIVPSSENSLLYLKDATLYSYSIGKSAKCLAENVKEFVATDSQKVIAYVTADDSLYIINKSKAAELLDTAVSSVQLVTDGGVVYYVKNQVLYKTNQVKNKAPNKVKIQSGATDDTFIFDGANQASFYFLTRTGVIVKTGDCVSDSYYESDKALVTQPTRPAEPVRASFPDGMSYNEAMEQYEKDLQEYLLAVANYNSKKTRDELRGQIKNDKITLSTYQLYYYNGKKATCLCENLDPETIVVAPSNKKIACISGEVTDAVGTLADISEFGTYEELLASLSERYSLQGKRKLNLFSGKKTIKTNTPISSIFGFSEDSKNLFISQPDLALMKISSSGKAQTVTDNAFERSDVITLSGKTVHYVLSDNGSTSICCNGTVIDTDVLVNSAVSANGKIYYITDNTGNSGTLKCYDGGKASVVAYDVSDFTVTEAGNVSYVSNGSLYFSTTNKPVAENVTAVLEYVK